MIKLFIISALILESIVLNAQDINGNRASVNKKDEGSAEQILYFEGAYPTFFRSGLPFLYITFHDSGKVTGFLGYYPYKGLNYQACWTYDLCKTEGDSVYSGYSILGRVGLICKDDLKKIEVFNRLGRWYCRLEGEKRELLLQPYTYSSKNEERRNLIFYLARREHDTFVFETNFIWKQFWGTEIITIDTSVIHLPFKQLRDELERRYLNEFKRINSINSFKPNLTFYLFVKDNDLCVDMGRVVDSQRLFDLLKEAKPIERPEFFNPTYTIQCNPIAKGSHKKQKWSVNRNDYFFSNRVFLYNGFWYQFDSDVLADLKKLVMPAGCF